MPSLPIDKSFCTTSEAAVLLGVSVGTVQLWAESGLLEGWKTSGGHRRIQRDSVERLIHRSGPARIAPVPVNAPPLQDRDRLSIMVVDDDPNLLRLYHTQMSRWPIKPDVIAVGNAIAALVMIGRKGPDLLVTDLQMPGLDGFGMLQVLRQDPAIATTKIVVITGLDMADVARRGTIPAGVEVLPKPIPFDRLRAIATGLDESRFAMQRGA
jgi:excisionase family DNA binding protein